ncbi:MAG TPA: YkvA family protein [Propylenella sp.]|nr:YkvA family protein [Propylenella sp.]
MAKRSDWRAWAAGLRRDATALYLARRDPRVPWYAKVLAGLVVAYALSPIDLIPDFIPVLGLLDDVVIVPFGLWLVFRLLPDGLIEEYRPEAARLATVPRSRAAAIVIVAIWLALAAAGIALVSQAF